MLILNKSFVTFRLSKTKLFPVTFYKLGGFHSLVCCHSQWSISDAYTNPIAELQGLVQVPLLAESECVFSPDIASMKKADKMFKATLRGQAIATTKGVVNVSSLPDTKVPEVCFIGQSNVGKSSLIRSLFYDPPAVKISVSKTPGHTRAIKLYQLASWFTLVDVPGYGCNMPVYYVDSVEQYLQTRQQLVRTFLLLDAEDGITDVDLIGINMMEEFGKPYTIVLTKIDKTSPHKVLRTIFDLKQKRQSLMPSALPQPFLVSSLQDFGLVLLRTFIAHVTGHVAAS
jgi:ribosome biogenesis GTP-binding protein YsxC/EngB